jgi:hypothetical protein
MLQKGKQFLLHMRQPSCYKLGHEWDKDRTYCDYD